MGLPEIERFNTARSSQNSFERTWIRSNRSCKSRKKTESLSIQTNTEGKNPAIVKLEINKPAGKSKTQLSSIQGHCQCLDTSYFKTWDIFITPMFECQDTSLTEFALALFVALRYLETARCISSLTVSSPLPQGTITQTVSKHTVTFILRALISAQIL